MQRTTALALAVLFGATSLVLVFEARRNARSEWARSEWAGSARGEPTLAASELSALSATPPAGAKTAAPSPAASASAAESSTASAVPDLPADAPLSIEVGIVQVVYRGAQFAPRDAPTREIARARAEKLLALATQDFASAVTRGDAGSGVNLGTIPRGVLDPATEYVLFTLEVGQVSSALVETPRGFWIAKRVR
jgi:hypothetical protein